MCTSSLLNVKKKKFNELEVWEMFKVLMQKKYKKG